MITKRTIFVLGAGASAPFGYLDGRGLKEKIISEILPSGDLYQSLVEDGLSASEIRDFAIRFQKSGRLSIDAFLEHNPRLQHLGKLIIARALSIAETSNGIHRGDENWLTEFFKQVCGNAPDAIGNHNFGVVTFNYDRSLEHFLFEAVLNSFENATEPQVAQIIDNLHIVHVHGKMGDLPWEIKGAQRRRAYGSKLSSEIADSAKQIKIISDPANSAELDRARALLAGAAKAVFLGFGFHPENVSRLELLTHLHGKEVYASFHNMIGDEIDVCAKRIGRAAKPSLNAPGHFEHVNGSCLDVFRHFGSKIFS